MSNRQDKEIQKAYTQAVRRCEIVKDKGNEIPELCQRLNQILNRIRYTFGKERIYNEEEKDVLFNILNLN